MESVISGIFALLLGMGGLWTGWRALKNRKLLNLWKSTKGKVVERGVHQPNTPMLSAPAFRFAPLVRYVYYVDGKQFENNCIYPKRIQSPPHSSRKWAQKKADSYPDEVTIYYNPKQPGESYLTQTSKSILYTVIVISVLLILIAIVVLTIM